MILTRQCKKFIVTRLLSAFMEGEPRNGTIQLYLEYERQYISCTVLDKISADKIFSTCSKCRQFGPLKRIFWASFLYFGGQLFAQQSRLLDTFVRLNFVWPVIVGVGNSNRGFNTSDNGRSILCLECVEPNPAYCARNKHLCKDDGFKKMMKDVCPITCGYCKPKGIFSIYIAFLVGERLCSSILF